MTLAMFCCIVGPWSTDELDKLVDAVTKYIAVRQEFLQQGQVSESLTYIKARKDRVQINALERNLWSGW
jgi:hypothetical protein